MMGGGLASCDIACNLKNEAVIKVSGFHTTQPKALC